MIPRMLSHTHVVVSASLMGVILSLALIGCEERGTEPAPTLDPATQPADANADAATATSQPASAGTRSGSTGAAADLPETLPQIDLEGIQQLIAETAAQDRVLVLDFWATWCVPCVQMFPDIHTLGKELEDVRVVSITVDSPGEYEQQAIRFLHEQHSLDDAFLLDPEGDEQVRVVDAIGPEWSNVAVPAIFVFDREGDLAGEFLSGKVQPILESMRQTAGQ